MAFSLQLEIVLVVRCGWVLFSFLIGVFFFNVIALTLELRKDWVSFYWRLWRTLALEFRFSPDFQHFQKRERKRERGS